MSDYFPIYVSLRGKQCLVVGAGRIAAGKAASILERGANVTFVAPRACDAVQTWAASGLVTWHCRTFEEGDLDGVFLVFAATDDSAANQAVFAHGEARNLLVNVVDQTDLCNFIVPSVAQSGPVQVAVSTSGTSPALARRLRLAIQDSVLGPQTGLLASFLGSWRFWVNQQLPCFPVKKRFWEAVLASPLADLLASGDRRAAETLFLDLLDQHRHAPVSSDCNV